MKGNQALEGGQKRVFDVQLKWKEEAWVVEFSFFGPKAQQFA